MKIYSEKRNKTKDQVQGGKIMRPVLSKMSFRNKILSTLLVITFLLSGFSIFLLYSIDDVNKISGDIKDNYMPELIWLSEWESELLIKKYIVEDYLTDGEDFSEEYRHYFKNNYTPVDRRYFPIPPTLDDLSRRVELLDFKINNNVFGGLLAFGDEAAAKLYIESHYLPELSQLQLDILEAKENALHALEDTSFQFSSIIRKSVWLLLYFSIASIILSILMAYRISEIGRAHV